MRAPGRLPQPATGASLAHREPVQKLSGLHRGGVELGVEPLLLVNPVDRQPIRRSRLRIRPCLRSGPREAGLVLPFPGLLLLAEPFNKNPDDVAG